MAPTPAGDTEPYSRAVLQTLLEQSVAGIFVLDLEGRIVYLNSGFAQHFGRSADEMRGHSYFEFIPAAEVPARRAGFSLLARGQLPSRQVIASFERSSGERFELLTESTLASYEGVPAIIGVAADVTARRRVQHALERATRAQRTLTAANSALMRAQREPELLQEMCTLALEIGNYATAWIGIARNDAEKTVDPVARAGDDTDDLDVLAIRWDDSEFGDGPTGRAIRRRAPVVVRNLSLDLLLPSWEDYHRQRGHRAIIALPLIESGSAFGALTLASFDPDAFDEEEVALLEQLSSDISYGIAALRNKDALRIAEQRSRDHAARLEALWKVANNPRLTGDDLTDAMLLEACRTIRPGLPYGGALFRIEGDQAAVEAFCETPEYTARKVVTADLRRGLVIPVEGTAVKDVLAYGLGTWSWDHMLDVLPSPR